MDALIERLKEPSTYAGLGGMFVLLGTSQEQFDTYVAGVSGVFLFLSILLSEKK